MTTVIDASVAIKWFVKESGHDEALDLLDQSEPLQAPDFIVPEVANIAWKKCLRGEITREQAHTLVATLPHYVSVLHASVGLVERSLNLSLALKHPVYDCLYIACVEYTDGVLVTADKRLCNVLRDNGFGALVRLLGNPNLPDGPKRQ